MTDGVQEYDLFVDGEHVASDGTNRISVEYPYDGTTWASVPAGTSSDVDRAIASAKEALESEAWGGLLPSERAAVLRDIGATIDDHSQELAELETRQNGKLIRETNAQLTRIGDWFRYFAGHCETLEGRTVPVENKDGEMFNYVRREPQGVVGAITPWNSPLLLTVFKLAPALAAGCTFVHKPSSYTPVSAIRFAELLHTEAGLPAGVCNVVTGSGSTVGDAISNHDGLDKLAFTGSTEVGRMIGRDAGENLKPVSLELGGKSPNIVFPSANLENAVNGVIKGIFAASGQTCLAGSRVFVHESIADEFVSALTDRTADIRLGDPMEGDTEMGPVAYRGQWETIKEYIETGVAEGAHLEYGGEMPADAPGECFIQPTIFTGVDNDMTIAREEIFGPVASVLTFAGEDEVVETANDTPFGLASGVWTEDMRQAHRVAARLEAGTVWVNEYRLAAPNSPFGGYKDSGLGYENGDEAMEEYLKSKSVWMDLSGSVSDPFKLG